MSLLKKMQIPNKIVVQLSIVCVLVIDCYCWKGEVVGSAVQPTTHGLLRLRETNSAESRFQGRNGSTLMTIEVPMVVEEKTFEDGKNIPYNFFQRALDLKGSKVQGKSAFMALQKEKIKVPIIRKNGRALQLTMKEDIILENKSKLMETTVPMVDGELQSQFSLHTLTNSSMYRETKESGLLNGYLSDVVMVVHGRRKKASRWTFLKPLTPEMWLTTAAIMIYTALVVWLLEQKINPLSIMEIFALICSAASTMSLTQNLRIQSRSGRVVIAVWLLVMSIIVTSYADNFNSRLNAQETNPAITIMSLKSLLATHAAIGYLKHNSKNYYLGENLRIDKEKLKAYRTPEQCAKALSKSPNKAGVVAVLMNPEDARQFVSERHGYTIYHISLWDFPTDTEMPNSLGVKNFSGWFIITASVSTLAVIMFFFNLLYSLRRGTIADTTEQDVDPQLEMLPPNEASEEQSSVEGESAQKMLGTSKISKSKENASIEASSAYIPHIADQSHSMEERDA